MLLSNEFLSVASTSVQLLLPEDKHFSATQKVYSALSDLSYVQLALADKSTHLSRDASPKDYSLKPIPIENLAAADPSSSCEARGSEPPHRRRKPRGHSSERTEPLLCLSSGCSKSFVRRCELA